ncbi:MAG TPA: hypothetical protein DCO83_05320 [Mucilaginibacter sp.]|jgi:hypothetical protein|nr:hypothetical protein [Mucilaginibacter sp.]
MDYTLVPHFDTYDEDGLKELFLWHKTSEQLVEIKVVHYDSDSQRNIFQARLTETCYLDLCMLTDWEKYEEQFGTKLSFCPNYYQGDELKTFYHGPQKILYFIGASDYRTPSTAYPVAIVIIAGFVVIIPKPKL